VNCDVTKPALKMTRLLCLQAALAAEMLAENAVIAASDMLVSVRAAEKEERELQVRPNP
jgi:hypothetical protein